jgi:hypothetical protein
MGYGWLLDDRFIHNDSLAHADCVGSLVAFQADGWQPDVD